MTEQADTETDHEIDCCYSGGVGEPYYQPFFSCSCGFKIRAETWEEAGSILDAHLSQAKAEGRESER